MRKEAGGLFEEAMLLKEEKNAAVVAHYYVSPEVQAAADYVGDSFKLASLVSGLENEMVVFCGVRFMGESAKLICPDKRVLLPEPEADCPMAHMVDKRLVDTARAKFGEDLAVVCYVNSSIEVKSWSDVCVTSSNALKIVSSLQQSHVLFIPDCNLGAHLAKLIPQKSFILGEGFCPVHKGISVQAICDLKKSRPQARVLAHPECSDGVREIADVLGSTAALIEEAARGDAPAFVIATAAGVENQMRIRSGVSGKDFLFPDPKPVCADMRKITLEKLVSCLRYESGEVELPLKLAERAKRPLLRMLEMS